MKLTNKAQVYLKKLQNGAEIFDNLINPNQFGSDSYNITNFNNTQPLSSIPNSLQRDYQQSIIDKQKQDQLLLNNLKTTTNSLGPSQTQQQLDSIGSVLGQLNPLTKVGMGLVQILESKQQKKEARIKEKMFDEEMRRRKEQQRLDGYYQTPYTTYKKGGKYQLGGPVAKDSNLDLFSQFYQQQEDANQQYTQSLQDYYDQLNEIFKNRYQTTKRQGQTMVSEGVSDTVAAIQKIVTLAEGGEYRDGGAIDRFRNKVRSRRTDRNIYYKDKRQEGGEEPNPNPNLKDIYSEEFDPQVFNEVDKTREVLNLEISKSNQEFNEENILVDWILQDEEPNYSPIEEEYYQGSAQFDGSIIDKIAQNESGGDYSVVNPRGGATGKYQFMPVWSGQIRDFMGLSKNLSKEQIMETFRSNPEAQDQFMNHVVTDIYGPIVEELRPVAKKYGFSDNDLIKFLHYRGEGDTRKRLKTGNFEVSQDEVQKYKNPQILEYLNR